MDFTVQQDLYAPRSRGQRAGGVSPAREAAAVLGGLVLPRRGTLAPEGQGAGEAATAEGHLGAGAIVGAAVHRVEGEHVAHQRLGPLDQLGWKFN